MTSAPSTPTQGKHKLKSPRFIKVKMTSRDRKAKWFQEKPDLGPASKMALFERVDVVIKPKHRPSAKPKSAPLKVGNYVVYRFSKGGYPPVFVHPDLDQAKQECARLKHKYPKGRFRVYKCIAISQALEAQMMVAA